MSRHSLDSVVHCHDGDGRPTQLGVDVDGRTVLLLLPGSGALRLTLQQYDRFKHLLVVAGNSASWNDD